MAKIDNEEEIIRDLESRLSEAQARVHWLKTDRDAKELVQVERLIELMETKTFSDWFNENVIKDNPEINDSINDMVEDVIDYSDTFRERVNDIFQAELYELTHDIKQGIIDEVEDVLPVMVRNVLKGLKVKVTYDEIN